MENPRQAKHPLQQIADATGGTIKEVGALPDGSGFAIMSMPLPETHWIYGDKSKEFEAPPMILRMGHVDSLCVELSDGRVTPQLNKDQVAELIRTAGKYAVRCATMKGKEMDFDPDALLQNLVVAFLGYWTENGFSNDSWANPPINTEPPQTA